MGDHLLGKKLIGDDFDEVAIRQWFADEAEGYETLDLRIRMYTNINITR